jgi:hypothetical protein
VIRLAQVLDGNPRSTHKQHNSPRFSWLSVVGSQGRRPAARAAPYGWPGMLASPPAIRVVWWWRSGAGSWCIPRRRRGAVAGGVHRERAAAVPAGDDRGGAGREAGEGEGTAGGRGAEHRAAASASPSMPLMTVSRSARWR